MQNGKQSAYPIIWDRERNEVEQGLTKREYFAGLAMQGLLASMTEMSANGGGITRYQGMCENLAIECVDMADALLKQLEINDKK